VSPSDLGGLHTVTEGEKVSIGPTDHGAITHAYGPDPDQYAELYLPEGTRRPGVVVIVHGGFWRAAYDASLGRPLVVDLVERGWVVWNIEYRRVGRGGGWPKTFQHAADAIDLLADLDVDTSRVVAIGPAPSDKMPVQSPDATLHATTVWTVVRYDWRTQVLFHQVRGAVIRMHQIPGRAVGAVFAVVGLLQVAACGSSSPTPVAATTRPLTSTTVTTSGAASTSTTARASTAAFNSCSVVTQAEAASALGQPVSAGVLGNATVEGGLACVFYGPSSPSPTTPNSSQPDTVRVVVVEGGEALTWYDNYKASPEVHAEPITGYGIEAFFDGGASLSVLKGADYLRVAVIPAGAPPSLSDEEQLAKAVLPKL
jgi:hypothetical protein